MIRPLAINCYSYIWRYSACETLAHLAEHGHRRFELMVNWPHLWPSAMGHAARRRISRLLEEKNLKVLSLAPPMLDLNLVSNSPEVRRYSIDHYIDVIRLAGEWCTPWVVVVPGKIHPLLPLPSHFRDKWFEDALEEMDRAAEAEGVKLTIENVPSSYLPHADDLMRRLTEIGNPRLGVTYDVANAVFVREDPAEGLRVVAPKLEFVHLSDTGVTTWAHSTIGTGVVPFDRIAVALDDIGFTGPSTLEVISQTPDDDIAASCEALSAFGWSTADEAR
ncbi:sugar phosphate isomerase/epimerase [Microvirga sp. KLBC 81]|uniref:sugar phosphate isomerase/epimerase family protein n=1 Tax=Microvirga sp. KLBC 81 TaxID=1862707 RepID=UPI001403591E|nr:sugar phosphate isomerase/epimerase family protein [Microvirga sp. KLBC 81]